MHDAAELESRATPTAVIVTEAFVRESEAQRQALGLAELTPVVITHPLSTISDAEIEDRAAEAATQVVTVLMG